MNAILWLGAFAGLAFATLATAESRSENPLQPDAPAAPLRYESAFDRYRPLGDSGVGNWRQVNDRVRDAAASASGQHGSQAPLTTTPHGSTPQSTPPAPARSRSTP